MQKEDEIMAEYLLKGAKMLAKTCPECGCPLFEYKDTTRCVVCTSGVQDTAGTAAAPVSGERQDRTVPNEGKAVHTMAVPALEQALVALCERAANETDPGRCLTLMEAVHRGAEALRILTR
jgi:UPF0148 protein